MVRKRKLLGRHPRPLPPRIDATAEEIAQAMFKLPFNYEWEYMKTPGGTIYRCAKCGKVVSYPGTLYNDGKCEACTKTLTR